MEQVNKTRRVSSARALWAVVAFLAAVTVGAGSMFLLQHVFAPNNSSGDLRSINVTQTSSPTAIPTEAISVGAPFTDLEDDYIEPGNPYSGTRTQPDVSLDVLNTRLVECLNRATNPGDSAQITDLTRDCFYSINYYTEYFYGIKSIGSGTITDETRTFWSEEVDLDTAKKRARTYTTVWVDHHHVANVDCFWDVALMSCKPQQVRWTQYGYDMHNRSVMQEVEVLK